METIDEIGILHERHFAQRILGAWWWRAHLQRLQRGFVHLRESAIQHWRIRLCDRLIAARAGHQARECWMLSRQLAASGVWARRRWTGQCRRSTPPVRDWLTHLERPGAQGGQWASCVWMGKRCK